MELTSNLSYAFAATKLPEVSPHQHLQSAEEALRAARPIRRTPEGRQLTHEALVELAQANVSDILSRDVLGHGVLQGADRKRMRRLGHRIEKLSRLL